MELPVKDGKQIAFFDVEVNPLFDQKGVVFGAVGILHDVTERKMAEQMREDFVANISHEVRTPLTAVKGFVQLLKNMSPEQSGEITSLVGKIEINADHLTALFNDILHLSVIESKKVIEKETIALKDFTNNIIANVKQGHPAKKLKISTSFAIEKVWANPTLLEQVLSNLIDNAYKYTAKQGEVFITWKQISKGAAQNKFDVLIIEDSGIGIPKEHQPRIFERFYRVDPGRSREMGGTGLGLAIVKHIVQNHLGQITVKSKMGKGSIFTVEIPAHY